MTPIRAAASMLLRTLTDAVMADSSTAYPARLATDDQGELSCGHQHRRNTLRQTVRVLGLAPYSNGCADSRFKCPVCGTAITVLAHASEPMLDKMQGPLSRTGIAVGPQIEPNF